MMCGFRAFSNFGRGVNRWSFKPFLLEWVNPGVCFGEMGEGSIFRDCLPVLDALGKSLLTTSFPFRQG